jgi:hypothetical protein
MKVFKHLTLFLLLPLTFLYAQWYELDSVPEPICAGQGIVYGGGYVWATASDMGDGFYAYDVNQNQWITLDIFPGDICDIGAIAYETEYERRIFVVDDYDLYFYTKDYTTGYEGSWNEPIELPDEDFEEGTCITFQHCDVTAGTGYLYLLRGGGGTEDNFFRRAIEEPTQGPRGSPEIEFKWEKLEDFYRGATAGAAMCFNKYRGNKRVYTFGGGGDSIFYYYDINGDSWVITDTTPRVQNDGSSLASSSTTVNNLRAIFGENSDDSLFRYKVSANEWKRMPYSLPNTLGPGASIAPMNRNDTLFTYLVIGGERKNFYVHVRSLADEQEEGGGQSSSTMLVLEKAKVSTSSDGISVWYSTRTSTRVKIQVYNLAGKLVKTLLNGKVASGEHFVCWNKTDKLGRSAPAGVYFITIDKDKLERLKVVISE